MTSPSSFQTQHWANLKETTSGWGIRILLTIDRLLGRTFFRVCLLPVLLWYIATQPIARAASYQYLNKIAAVKNTPPPTLKDVIRHFMAFGESILDKFLLLNHRFDVSRVSIFGQPMMLQCVAQKKGALIICAHFGNFEICKVLSRNHPDLKITMLVHDRHAVAFNQLLKKSNRAGELQMIQVTEISPSTAILLKEKIDQGEMIVIAGDRIPVSDRPRTQKADFLGSPAHFPVGAYALASLLGAPIYLMFVYQTQERFNIVFEKMSDAFRLPRNHRDEVLKTMVGQFAARLEYYCLQAPTQWFNFYNFWQDSDDSNDQKP
ncbi:MAG: acyltransferase [Burkholderiales bacterium]|nr:acyltransferase [Burkholderiales bacterium]